MPMCGFNAKMLQGLTAFAQGLYDQAHRLAKEQGIPLEDAMEKEIHEMNVFLAALDETYEELRRSGKDVDEAMRELSEWTKSRLVRAK